VKALTRFAAAAVLALGATSATQVVAGPTCGACFYAGTTTYLGSFNPLTNDAAFFLHNVPQGAFGDTWVFDIAPAVAAGQANANFVIEGTISSFEMTLYATTSDGSCLVLGGACAATPGFGSVLGSVGLATPGASAPLNFSELGVGRYVLQVNGTSTDPTGTLVSGQLKVFVPEPASLGLAGLGLIAAAGVLRRRKSV
jgi:hypothetical protein